MKNLNNQNFLSYPKETFIPNKNHVSGILYLNRIELKPHSETGDSIASQIKLNSSKNFMNNKKENSSFFKLKKSGQLEILRELQEISKINNFHCFIILSFEAAHVIEEIPIYDNDTVLAEFMISECSSIDTNLFLNHIKEQKNNDLKVPKCHLIQDSSDQYFKNYDKVMEHFKEGDVYELVLFRKLEFKTDPLQMFNYLKNSIALQRAPYRFALNFFQTDIIGASPEILIDIENENVTMKPISGSIRRASNEYFLSEQELLELEKLYSSEKEKCELDMLVDLARNDLNRFCKNVSVSNYREPLILEHIIHTQSTVTGKLKSDFDCIDAILSSINAGTLVGVPKRKAMEIISNSENEPRKFYGGNLIHIKPDGNIIAIILIRTAFLNQSKITFQAGSSIIFEANKDYEYWECGSKLKNMLSIINQDHYCFNENKSPEVVLNLSAKFQKNKLHKKKLLMIENFDSFTYNLVSLFENCGADVDIIRNTTKDFDFSKYDGIILSPGPSHPKEAGYLIEHIQNLIELKPIFGVCLGFQAIIEACGGKVSKLKNPVHGKARTCYVENSKILFQSLPNEFEVGRYHSLYAENIPKKINIVAYDELQTPMALEYLNKKSNVCAVQFHPESFLTGAIGEKMIKNWMESF
ncbi:chorismate-binding protein [Silvanigrella sp.]|jgi:anthranilate synthase|uniref:chorismate-binding protein n=1 Tax=Silvanigrella sp. TaxID=2024976 RepID=UPI0037C75E0B